MSAPLFKKAPYNDRWSRRNVTLSCAGLENLTYRLVLQMSGGSGHTSLETTRYK